MNLMKLICAIFRLYQNFFQASVKRAKLIMITILKYLEQHIVVEQFQIVLSKQNGIFEFRILSYPLNFFHV